MTTASNLYASRVYSEHPIISWPLDDNISYISLINEENRSFTDSFQVVNGTATDLPPIPDGPFPDSVFTELTAINSSIQVKTFSQNLFNLQDLNQDMNTFAINAYFYTEDSVLAYEYGYRYLDPYSSQYIEDTRVVEDTRFGTWIRIGGTFNPPNVNSNVQIVFKFLFSGGASPSVIMNGLSVGQWSESTNNKTLGVIPQPITDTELASLVSASATCVKTEAYGISQNDGYFLIEDNRLLAVNSGVPMVFGSDNITRLNPSASGTPAAVFPGAGVLNNAGRYNSYTVEMWIRLENNSSETRRIWGPLASDHGLYIKRGYISLVIGNSIGSYFIAEWYRPMLVHVTLRENQASVLINGEEVISITFDSSSIVLPEIDEDWFGFYCHPDMPIFEIDCISILPYVIPSAVAKRRFVWGQGVESPETINSAYQGTVAYIDYPYAQYTANQLYPDIANWDAAYFENMAATNRSLAVPDYDLPTIYLSEKTLQEFYDDNYAIQEVNHARYMSFRPNNTWVEPCYYLFDSFNILTDVVRGFWAVFEVESATLIEEPLVHFVNTINNDRFEINIDGTDVSYTLYKNGQVYGDPEYEVITEGEHFIVGLHLPRLFNFWGNAVGEFFGNPSAIQVYIGGDGTDTFSGYIYRVGFSNQTNLNEIENHFDAKGFAMTEGGDDLNTHLGSYTLLPTEDFGRYFLDIGISSYWEEYYPLSYFASYLTDIRGDRYYDLDFMQYNIGYPTTTTIVETSASGSWTYAELQEEYASPVIRPYEALDNALITGYDNYIDLQNRITTEIDYDFSNSSVRSYITFQRISSGANRPLSEYTNYQSLPDSNVLDVPQYSNIFSTKFEIKDQSIIYPPKNYGVENTAIVLHLDIKINGIKTNPLNLRKMSIASKALNENVFNQIGTRFGSKLYPYSKTGIYYVTNKQNPYAMYTGSSPYLYLTKYSGIESLGQREYLVERGISLPINEQSAPNQKVSAIQLWVKYSDDTFPQVNTTLFSLDSSNIDLGFQIVSDQSGERGKLYAINLSTKEDYVNLTFYQDGVQVFTPYLEKNKWTVIGINFGTPIEFSNYVGAINLFQSAVFNDIAYYKSTTLQEEQSVIYRRWENVDGTTISPLDWLYWTTVEEPFGKWDNVLKVAQVGAYGVNPATLFKSYSGTNRQIVDDNKQLTISDSGVLIFASAVDDVDDRVVVSNSPQWTTYTRKPV